MGYVGYPTCRESTAYNHHGRPVVYPYRSAVTNPPDIGHSVLRMLLTDAVTGALARGGLKDCLDGAIARARLTGGSCSVFVFDIDHFKTVNDEPSPATSTGSESSTPTPAAPPPPKPPSSPAQSRTGSSSLPPRLAGIGPTGVLSGGFFGRVSCSAARRSSYT